MTATKTKPKTKPGRGRPRLHVQRTEMVFVRCSPDELKTIKRAAVVAGLDTSSWVRTIALKNSRD